MHHLGDNAQLYPTRDEGVWMLGLDREIVQELAQRAMDQNRIDQDTVGWKDIITTAANNSGPHWFHVVFERDLARPVIEIQDFETSRLEYEIYTFGEENVIIPVSKGNHQKLDNNEQTGIPLKFDFAETKTAFLLDVGREYSGNVVDAFVDEKYLSSLRTNRKGHAKILKRSNIGKRFSRLAKSKDDIRLLLNNY